MADYDDVESWRGAEVVDAQGQKVGKVDEVYRERSSGDAVLASVPSRR